MSRQRFDKAQVGAIEKPMYFYQEFIENKALLVRFRQPRHLRIARYKRFQAGGAILDNFQCLGGLAGLALLLVKALQGLAN